ncbi:hypothetical protein B296_00015383 [Ensete ventricosum]|uniref:Uncharacterized protein n=1 Tax=Ensete ventricosum TaxID=4639 RepID=A0A426ZF90_ENSVE|nr:hypothetical protein B296_00015383 [Ensete ventricosum]
MLSSTISEKNTTVINFAQIRVSFGFSGTNSEFQYTGHSQRINLCEVVRAQFHKKTRRSKTLRKFEFRSIFCTPSRNFKTLAILNILAHEMSYEHGFMKKYDGNKFCAKSSVDRFFTHCLRISKYCPFPLY